MRVKNSSKFAALCRPNWKRRGAFFGLCSAAGALITVVFGRSIPDFSQLTTPSAAPLPDRTRDAKRNRSLSDALSKIDGQTVQAYLERWSNPEKAAKLGAPRAVFIDSEALARRHPAWRLAMEIERGAVSPASPVIARVLAVPAGKVSPALGPSQSAAAFQTSVISQTITSGGAMLASPDAPNRALERFLAENAARAAKRASDQAFLARRALDDAVALARRGAVSEAEIAVLPPDVALELLNLRLELLRDIARTPAQRAASRAAIRIIEARYAAILARQTDAQAARLRAATIDLPNQRLREGRVRIARESQFAARQAAQTRLALGAQNREERRRDIETSAPLRITLPAAEAAEQAAFVLQVPRVDSPESRPGRAEPQFFETAPGEAASKPPIERERTHSSAVRAALAVQLRDMARRDAAQWARQGAGYFGARWDSSQVRSDAPDFTPQTLRLLFPTISR